MKNSINYLYIIFSILIFVVFLSLFAVVAKSSENVKPPVRIMPGGAAVGPAQNKINYPIRFVNVTPSTAPRMVAPSAQPAAARGQNPIVLLQPIVVQPPAGAAAAANPLVTTGPVK